MTLRPSAWVMTRKEWLGLTWTLQPNATPTGEANRGNGLVGLNPAGAQLPY